MSAQETLQRLGERDEEIPNVWAWIHRGVDIDELERALGNGLVLSEAFCLMLDECPMDRVNEALKLSNDGFECKSTNWLSTIELAPYLDRITLAGKS